MKQVETQVAVIGAGPVGLTVAMDLAQRGVDVVVLERRAEDEPADPKCNSVSSRTMEIFRRLGVADAVRAAGLDDDFPTDVIYATSIAGKEFTRITLPSRNERFGPDGRSASGYLDSNWLTPEPVVRLSQYYLNSILQAHATSFAGIRLCHKTEFISYDAHSDGVRVNAQNKSGSPVVVHARYLIGCDGGGSQVRKQMGVSLLGDAEISRTRTTFVRSPDLLKLFPGKPAWMSWILNPRVSGTVVAIDGRELWLLHRSLPRGAEYFEDLDSGQSIRDLLGVGDDFSWEQISHQDWVGRRLVAAGFRDGRVFIAGDAAHLWIPFAGYGMNAGIADGTNLSWMMAAVLNGHANERLLDAHEAERHPITEQVSRLAMGKALEYAQTASRRQMSESIERDDDAGRLAREQLGEQLYEINAPQFACAGLNFGYYYDQSPIVAYDSERAPAYDMAHTTPSTVPGCRLPHFWLSDGRSVYDALGNYYTLLCVGGAVNSGGAQSAAADSSPVEAFADACKVAGLLLEILPVSVEADCFKHGYLLVRPDQHVAWRGNALPADPSELIEMLKGIPTSAG